MIWLVLELSWSDYNNQFSEYPSSYIYTKLKKEKVGIFPCEENLQALF